ncbi:adenylate/guanylate cyclase domain-containing protein [Rhizobium tubonense]|uniref:Adenylate/guanylate cyclase domain-containing protein n=1 Tax=Rhizobium tubonense TaxID=484088 RepID=A0A2W4C6S4_9HYPH|nr:adenylate/guanylate cyclase domain-containing protein [Rhizobium tubonense]PZM09202.1 adenylate/guanylate cyclase domain-containing protein [Rhizobium tubonense]
MSETQRKLTTIFSADVQDYTRLMGVDEEGTLATLKRYRDAMSRLIGAHGGRVINTWGDGVIAEFPSVVEAVRGAVDVQNELAGLNAARPSDGRMLFRIGINLGDVIVDGDDIYGDGVNIAARLQATAAAGGIVISNTVYDQVRNKVAVGFDFLGPLTVKNVADAVPSYAVRIGEGTSAPPQPVVREPRATVSDKSDRRGRSIRPKSLGTLAVIAVALLAINILTWKGTFWAAWPLLALAVARAMVWARSQDRIDTRIAVLTVAGLGITSVNLLAWHGTFWAIWPLLALAIAAGIRWTTRG